MQRYVLLCIALMTASCGDDDSAADAGSKDAATPTLDAPVLDADTTDAAVLDADTTDADTTDADTTDAKICPTDCPAPTSMPATGQQIVIDQLDFTANTVTVRNVSGGSLDISTWRLCQGPGTYLTIATTPALADNATVVLPVSNGLAASSELGIYELGLFTTPSDMRAYVRWGTSDLTTSSIREPVATGATPPLWTVDDFVDVCPGDEGLVAIGDATIASGFRSVAGACL